MEAAAWDPAGEAEEYEYEEIVEEVQEEVEEEVQEEVEEEVEEDGAEEDAEGLGGGEGSEEKGVDTVDSAGRDAKQSVSGSSSEGKIFVGGLAWETTEDKFAKHFKKYGEITDSVIMKEKATGRPRGFGFITYADPSIVDKVLEDEHAIDGRLVEVKRTVPRESMSKGGSKTKKIFVGGLPTSLTEDEFKEYFSSYGKVAEHQIMLDHKTGRSRGFGFITFENEDSVEDVISQGKMHTLGGKQVEIKKAEPKKAGGEGGMDGRPAYGPGGNAYSGGYGDGRGFRSGGMYGGQMAGPVGGYGRGYGYGGGFGYGMGYGLGYSGPMYGAAGFGGSYGYGGASGYGGSAGAYGSGYGGGGGARYGGRYHPYGR